MEFWSTQQGPVSGGDTRREGQRCVGEVVCPECSNVLARLYDATCGVLVDCWVPVHGAAPGDPNGRSVGWRLGAFIDAGKAETASVLPCWRGHHGFVISTTLCREVDAAYRGRGKTVRRPATRVEGDPVGYR